MGLRESSLALGALLLIACVMMISLYPEMCILLMPAFVGVCVLLSVQGYEILKVKKQAFIKAYYKENSLFYRYFGRFVVVKIVSFCFGLLGSACLVFMLLLPAQGELTLCVLLLPLNLYMFRIVKNICLANLSEEFAPLIAKKYTAIFCALIACVVEIYLGESTALQMMHSTLQEQYQALLGYSHIESLSCEWLREILGFVLLKKVFLDVVFAQAQGTWLYVVFVCLYAFGHFTAFMAFSILCLSGVRLDTRKLSVGVFPSLLFLITLSLGFSMGAYLQPIAKIPSTHHTLLSSKLLAQNTQYIEIGMQGVKVFVDTRNMQGMTQRFQSEVGRFQHELDEVLFASIDEYFAHKEEMIEAYTQWYFSVYGEYTRLLYTAFGKGEELAQEQFITLLQAHTPYDLNTHLNALYDEHLERLKSQMQHMLELFSAQHTPQKITIQSQISFDEFIERFDLLSPHKSDGISAVLGGSILGGVILKSSGKFLGKSMGKILGKGAVQKGVSSVAGAGSSVVCGVFAPLCAIGIFVATDYTLNQIDRSLHEEEFKALMRSGLEEWELQLKNSLASYNAQLVDDIFQLLPFWDKTYKTKE